MNTNVFAIRCLFQVQFTLGPYELTCYVKAWKYIIVIWSLVLCKEFVIRCAILVIMNGNNNASATIQEIRGTVMLIGWPCRIGIGNADARGECVLVFSNTKITNFKHNFSVGKHTNEWIVWNGWIVWQTISVGCIGGRVPRKVTHIPYDMLTSPCLAFNFSN